MEILTAPDRGPPKFDWARKCEQLERELTRYKRLEAILRNEADADYHEGRQRMNDAMRFLSEWENT